MSKPRYEDVHRKCALCGKDITGPFGTYRFGLVNGMICYDCDAKVTEENRRRRQAVNAKRKARKVVPRKQSIAREVKQLHKAGKRPSEIAEILGIDAKRVYEELR